MLLTAPLRGAGKVLAHFLHGISRRLAKGILMTFNLNRLAWIITVLTIVIWAFLPRMAMAYPVMFPKIPEVDTLPLPPAPISELAEQDR